MALTPSFTVTQSLGSPESITVTDTSAGSDGAIASRRVYVKLWDGTFLVQEGTTTEYEVWDYVDTFINLDVLEKDVAAIITVQWLNSSNVVLYDKVSPVYGFTLYNETFDYNLTQVLSINPLLINDNSFYNNKNSLRTNIDSGDQAIGLASDQFAAQLCYNRATDIRLNSEYYFNTNS